jgi:hypothetical protein
LTKFANKISKKPPIFYHQKFGGKKTLSAIGHCTLGQMPKITLCHQFRNKKPIMPTY